MYEFDLEDKDYGVASGYFDDDEMGRGGVSSFEYEDDLPTPGQLGGGDLIRKSLP